MSCPACDGEQRSFAVPPSLRPYAPDTAAWASLCTTCLRVVAADANDVADADADVEWEPLPTGEAGVAVALLLGLLDSLALRRADVTALLEHAEAAGGSNTPRRPAATRSSRSTASPRWPRRAPSNHTSTSTAAPPNSPRWSTDRLRSLRTRR